MKKIFFITLFLIVAFVSINAQGETGDVYFTPKVGCNYATFFNRNGSYKLGFVGGVNMEYSLSSKVAIGSEAFFTHQGCHDVSIPSEETKYDYRLNLLDFNVFLKYYPVKHFDVFVGGQAARVLHARGNYEDIIDDLNKGFYGATGGFGFEFGKVILDARYVYYFNKIAKDNDTHTKAILKDATLNSIWVTVGYKIQWF